VKVNQFKWTQSKGWNPELTKGSDVSVLLVFGSRPQLQQSNILESLKSNFPQSIIIGGSTSGEILDNEVFDNSVVVTALTFEKTKIKLSFIPCDSNEKSFAAGEDLARNFEHSQLKHVLVMSNGLHVNGTELARGMSKVLPPNVAVTGGLAGDAADFTETYVVTNEIQSSVGVAAIGLYGDNLNINYGSAGGWRSFGPERTVTKSEGSTLYELDENNALDLYKIYLGDKQKELPGSALLFPLMITRADETKGLVRTILSVDDTKQSMTFAGDISQGATAQLMRANTENLIEGASDAAKACVLESSIYNGDQLAILVSCVGRKLVMKQRVEEEVEIVKEIIGDNTKIAGFYSYGELAPYENNESCELHNQTMTITLISES
tara:strand:+ start:1812 stop:2948 length:1137 start_codon:yes stop_codon:yes gene_type:complete